MSDKDITLEEYAAVLMEKLFIPVEYALPELAEVDADGDHYCYVIAKIGSVAMPAVYRHDEHEFIGFGGVMKDVEAWLPMPRID